MKSRSLTSVFCTLAYMLFHLFKTIIGAGRMSYGDKTAVGEFPHQIFMKSNVPPTTCGGNIINEDFILIAAHCVYGVKTEDIEIYAGVHDITPILQNANAKPIPIGAVQVFIHPCYVADDTQVDVQNDVLNDPDRFIKNFHDIALIKTKSKIPLNEDTIKTIPFDEENLENVSIVERNWSYGEPSPEGIVLGWGPKEMLSMNADATDEHNISILRKAFLELAIKYCFSDYRPYLKPREDVAEFFHKSHICSYTAFHVCLGISGGSLLCLDKNKSYILCGISTSLLMRPRGHPCYGRTAFTRIYYYRNWINDIIKSESKFDPFDDCYEPPPLPTEEPSHPSKEQGSNKGQEGRSTCPTPMYGTFIIWIFHLYGRIFF